MNTTFVCLCKDFSHVNGEYNRIVSEKQITAPLNDKNVKAISTKLIQQKEIG